jgi:ribosome biogenesis ATPase
LKRRSKKLLEDSIDRVLRVLEEEREDSESLEGDFEGIEEPTPVVKESNLINRSITKAWAKPTAASNMTRREATKGGSTPTLPIQSLENGVEESPTKPERQTNGEPKLKRRKGVERDSKQESRSAPNLADASFEHLAGIDDVIEQLEEISMVFVDPDMYMNDEVGDPPRGVLLHGPPGCGKTYGPHDTHSYQIFLRS